MNWNWPIFWAFFAGSMTSPYINAAVRWAWRKWRERGQSVAIGVDVAGDLASVAIAKKMRDGTVHYSVRQVTHGAE